MATSFNPRFLIVSLGNPIPKYTSLHSAGHFVLKGLAPLLHPHPFTYHKFPKEKCMISHGHKYTLIQSPTLMNVSGPFTKAAWRHILPADKEAWNQTALVIVHDELERDFGVVRSVPWDNSIKGHNGLRSVKSLIQQKTYPESPLVRIAVGIGRPEERDPETVAAYVLNPIPSSTTDELEGEVARKVKMELEKIEKEWRHEFEREQMKPKAPASRPSKGL